MIAKFRTKPYSLLCYEALFRRLKEEFRKNTILNEDYSNYAAGFHGEKSVDYTTSIVPHNNAMIYQDLRLKNDNYSFQMDTLIVSEKFILIMEGKHLAGELEYNPETKQLIQTKGNKKKAHKSPIYQAEIQKMHLLSWLQNFSFPAVPIETLAVLSNPAAILSKGDSTIFEKFILLDTLPEKLNTIYSKHKQNILDKQTMKKLNDLLLKSNEPYQPNLIKKFNLNETHFIKGIPCEKCHHYPMERQIGKWACSKCSAIDFKGHERVILDYFLLYKPYITNKECRELLNLKSEKTAYRLLKSMNLKYSGNNRARRYYAPPLDSFPQDSKIPIEPFSIF